MLPAGIEPTSEAYKTPASPCMLRERYLVRLVGVEPTAKALSEILSLENIWNEYPALTDELKSQKSLVLPLRFELRTLPNLGTVQGISLVFYR